MGKLSKDKRDIYYRLAKQNNYRSRAAYKLIQIDSYFNLLEKSSLIVDLCGAPGGFSQVCSERLKNKLEKKIISVDLQEIAPIEGVDIIKGDITNQETLQKILFLGGNKKVDLVLCDGAPDITGFNEFDVYVQSQLILTSLNISIRMLKEGGNFVTKFYKGKYTNKIMKIFLACFNKVTISKPKSCRNASFESFIVCEGFKLNHPVIKKLNQSKLGQEDMIILNNIKLLDENKDEEKNNLLGEFNYEKYGIKTIQVGLEEFDSDKSYDLKSTNYNHILNPIQMPINPPYKSYIKTFKGK